jgi:hypothetical protein
MRWGSHGHTFIFFPPTVGVIVALGVFVFVSAAFRIRVSVFVRVGQPPMNQSPAEAILA